MKWRVSIILMILGLSGCTNVDNLDGINQEMDDLIIKQEIEISDIKAEYDVIISELYEDLNELQNAYEISLSEELITDFEDQYEEYDKLIKLLFESDRVIEEDVWLDYPNGRINIFTEGEEILEDGISIIIQVFDDSEDLNWEHKWESIQVRDLSTHSIPVISFNHLYIVVDGYLNALDLESGIQEWEPIYVGSIGYPPRVDSDGRVYVSGQYGPYLTCITTEGEIAWQYITDDMVEVSNFIVTDMYIMVRDTSGIRVFDKDGNMIEF